MHLYFHPDVDTDVFFEFGYLKSHANIFIVTDSAFGAAIFTAIPFVRLLFLVS